MSALITRVKLLIQTQSANPAIRSGQVARYTGFSNCVQRISSEQGIASFWRGYSAQVLRYFPYQAFVFNFRDKIRSQFPKNNQGTEFWKFFATNVASGGLAGGCALSVTYRFDFLRTRLATDVGRGSTRVEIHSTELS